MGENIAELVKEIDQILSINVWDYRGLPNEIVLSINRLMKTHSRETLLSAMEQLQEPYMTWELRTRKSMGNSGMAAEQQQAAEMKVRYLKDSIRYVKDKSEAC